VETVIYLDTHVVAWLYWGQSEVLPKPVLRLLERESKWISPMVELELQLLFEIGRIGADAATVLAAVRADFDVELCDLPFHEVVRRAVGQSWTRDPFDRMIVAQAEVRGSRLLTRDATIRDHYQHALWLE
jgi:PIN domain nuclease of toxin-antitoxin system